MKDDFPLKKIDQDVIAKYFEGFSDVLADLINKEVSSIQSDMQRILNVVQESEVGRNS